MPPIPYHASEFARATDQTTCYIALFGGLRVYTGRQQTIKRFRTQKTAALLAYLAFYSGRQHGREELIERFWPDLDSLTAGRNNLSKALGSLRDQLEPPGTMPGSVLIADRTLISLNGITVTTDVRSFETLLRTGERAEQRSVAQGGGLDEKTRLWEAALALYTGPLLPGRYEEWIGTENDRLLLSAKDAAQWVSSRLAESGRIAEAVAVLRQILIFNPVEEPLVRSVIELLLKSGQTEAAYRQYNDFARCLSEFSGEEPPAELLALFPSKEFSFSAGTVPTSRLSTRPASQTANSATIAAKSRFAVSSARRKDRSQGSKNPGRSYSEKETDSFWEGSPKSIPLRSVRNPPLTAFPPPPVPTPSVPAPPRTLVFPSGLTVLPAPLTQLFGREGEINRLDALLAARHHRLITLTGPAGIGKTRIALAVAERWRGKRGPVYYVAAGMDTTLFIDLLTDALSMPSPAAGEDVAALAARLSEDPFPLLLLDGFDPLVGNLEVIGLLERLMRQVPHLVTLVTSCRRLPIDGEYEFDVNPLPCPSLEIGAASSLAEDSGLLSEPCADNADASLRKTYPAVALFLDRARLAQPHFPVSPHSIAQIADLVQRLEGFPLAIELAASRVTARSLREMQEQLPGNQEILVNTRRHESDRHRSLQGAFAWTVDMLSPRLRRVWEQLSVFRGGWTVRAAEAVTQSETMGDDLADLCAASLITIQPVITDKDGRTTAEPLTAIADDMDALRYTMLTSLRVFADDNLPEMERAGAQRRHSAFLRQRVETIEPHLQGAEQAQWLARLAIERFNLAAALDYCAAVSASDAVSFPKNSNEEAANGLRLATAAARYYLVRGQMKEGAEFLERAVLLSEVSSLPMEQGLLARALNAAGSLRLQQGCLEPARKHFECSLKIRQVLSDAPGIAATSNNLAILESQAGDYAASYQHYQTSLAAWRSAGDLMRVGVVLANLAADAICAAHYTTAEAWLTESLEIARQMGDTRAQASRLHNLGHLFSLLGRYRDAENAHRQSLSLRREIGDAQGCAYSVLKIALLLLKPAGSPDQDLIVRAVGIIARCEARLLDLSVVSLTPTWRQELEEALAWAKIHLDAARFQQAQKAEALPPDWDALLNSL